MEQTIFSYDLGTLDAVCFRIYRTLRHFWYSVGRGVIPASQVVRLNLWQTELFGALTKHLGATQPSTGLVCVQQP